MIAKPFLDTNVLIYAFSEDARRRKIATSLLVRGCLIGVQCLNEFAATARRKLRTDWATIRDALGGLRDLCPEPIPVTLKVHDRALTIAEREGYSIYDSLIVAAALEGGCSVLFSEDMQDGQRIEEVTIRNPFQRNGFQLNGR